MGFLKKFFRGVFHEGGQPAETHSSFEALSEEQLETHLGVRRYGRFMLTDAIRPSIRRQVMPRQGYRVETYQDARAGLKVPVLAASVSRERLFDLFLDLLDPLGDEVDVVLETSHDTDGTTHRDLYRENIDLPVLKSHLCDFEELLLHDGCAGIAVLSAAGPMEVQFDEHKLLVVYAHDLRPFEKLMREAWASRVGGAKSLKREITSAPSACLDSLSPPIWALTIWSRFTGSSM